MEEALSRFGLKAGTAFQMADDILDYTADEGELGKRLGKDLREGKITLPVVHALRQVGEEDRRWVAGLIRDRRFTEETPPPAADCGGDIHS